MVKEAKIMYNNIMCARRTIVYNACLPWLFESLWMIVQTSMNGTGELCSFINISKPQLLNYFFSNSAFNCSIIV